jgi:hypothetical protein
MNADLTKLNTSYDNLVAVLPNVLGKKMPIEVKRLGTVVRYSWNSKLTAKSIAAGLMNSDLGKLESVF